MKQIFHYTAVCSLIALMSFKLFGGFGYNLYFWWNQKELAREHCVNQNRPKMKCNGKCYLAKQLAKIENDYQKKQRQPAPFQLKTAEWIFIQDANTLQFGWPSNEEKTQHFYSWSKELRKSYTKIPTPPPNFV